MFKITMEAGKLASLVSKMTARECGGTGLFSPLVANVDTKENTISWGWITAENDAFTWGVAKKLSLSGKSGQYVFNSEIVDWINKLFGAEEKIVMEHHETVIKLKGNEWEGQVIPTDADATRIESAQKLVVEKKLPQLGKLKFNKLVELNITKVNAIVGVATLVYSGKDIKVIRFNFDVDEPTACIGSLEAHETGVRKKLEAKVSKPFKVNMGANFAEIISNMSGNIKLVGSGDDSPIWMLEEKDDVTVGYMVAPYTESQKEEGDDDDDGEAPEEEPEADEPEPEEEEEKEKPKKKSQPKETPKETPKKRELKPVFEDKEEDVEEDKDDDSELELEED